MKHKAVYKFPSGFKSSGIRCGIKEKGDDFAIIFSEKLCSTAGVFTKNSFKAASVLHNIKKLEKNPYSRAIVVNSGNANACTGRQGIENVEVICQKTAELLQIDSDEVLNASTGIIGKQLDMQKITYGIEESVKSLDKNNWFEVASAIMTTDTVEKIYSIESSIKEKKIRIAGICKGAGMICPNMATMLCFILTDVKINPSLLKKILQNSVDVSFNCLSVDGDMSTNDSVIIMANGEANVEIVENDDSHSIFSKQLTDLCIELAKMIAKDGEGASKFVEINVVNVDTNENAKKIAMSIANSALVKTALFGEDPNWGRVISAAGKTDVPIASNAVSLKFGNILMVENGEPSNFDPNDLKKVMQNNEISIELSVASGEKSAKVFTCDLTYEYVKINAEYHT